MTTTLEILDVRHNVPGIDDFRMFVSTAKGPVAFVGHPEISEEELRNLASSDADVTVYVVDTAAGTDGRAADLLGTLWQSFPVVAALLSHSLPRAGAVLFSTKARSGLASMTVNHDEPVTSAVMEVLRGGGTIRATLVPEVSVSGPASNPPRLSPRRPLSQAQALKTWLTAPGPRILGDSRANPDAAALHAGLLMWYDALEDGHELCQSVEGRGRNRAADYWHAIMHRREPDYGNAKYWFRRVGHHPIFDALAARAGRLAASSGQAGASTVSRLTDGTRWNAEGFVDACQAAASGDTPEVELLLRRLQADEMLLLLWQTCKDVFES